MWELVLICVGVAVQRGMYQRKVDVDMLNAVKNKLADVSGVSPSSEQRYVCMYVRTYVRTYVCMYVCMYITICLSAYLSVCLSVYPSSKLLSVRCSESKKKVSKGAIPLKTWGFVWRANFTVQSKRMSLCVTLFHDSTVFLKVWFTRTTQAKA